jgi:hypothetical protein
MKHYTSLSAVHWWYKIPPLWACVNIISLKKTCGSCDSSFSIVTWLQAGRPRFDSRQRKGKGFSLRPASRLDLGPTQPPIQWVLGAPFPGVKRPGREADHSLPPSAEIKNAWSYTSTPHTSSWVENTFNMRK